MLSYTFSLLASILAISATHYSNKTGFNAHVEWYSGDVQCWTELYYYHAMWIFA